MQSSANRSGEQDSCRLADVEEGIREGVDVQLDGGELPGISSTVVDLTRFEDGGEYRMIREGAVSAEDVESALA